VIAKECALIRTAFKEDDSVYRHRNVAKLIYISMLGYPTHFGQLETLKLIASPKFSDKRIGYLGMSLLIEDYGDVLTLVTNSLSQDLNNPNPYAVGLALAAMANVGSGEMLRDLSNNLHKILESADIYSKKKALLCAGLLFKHEPDLAPDFFPRISALLNDTNHAVQLTAMTCLFQVASQQSPEERKSVRKIVPVLVKILKKLVSSGFAPEYDVSGHNDPHLQVMCLKLVRVLGETHENASEHMSDILAQVATNTDSAKNAGNAILNEVVRTIMGIEAEPGLRVLAVNILGRFLANKDTNIKYVALATLERLVHIDTAAVQRHRTTIVSCLRDPDVSIRNRALDNVFHLIEPANVEELVREVVTYLGVAPTDQRGSLASRLADVVDRFPVSRKWQVEVLLDVLTVAGNQAPRQVWRHAVSMILQEDASSMRPYVAHRLFSVISKPNSDIQLGLAQTALAMVGEFGELLLRDPPASCAEAGFDCKARTVSEVLEVLERMQRAHDADTEVRGMALVALLKLSLRLKDVLDESTNTKLEELIGLYNTSMNLELQARSHEFTEILKQPVQKRKEILKSMPVPNEQELKRMRERVTAVSREPSSGMSMSIKEASGAGEINLLGDDSVAPSSSAKVGIASQPAAKSAVKSLIDLDDLFGGGTAMPAASQPFGASAPIQQQPPQQTNLLDLFGGGMPSAAPQMPMMMMPASPAAAAPMDLFGSVAPPQVAAPMSPPSLSTVIFNEGPLKIVMNLNSPAVSPGAVSASAMFFNRSMEVLTDVVLQVAVPTKYMTVKLSPASGSVVPPGSGSQITQLMEFSNSAPDKPYMMKLKVSYTSPSMGPVVAQAVVNDFPK